MEAELVVLGILLVLAFFVSFLGTYIIRWWALQHRLVDIPNERSSHNRPTPLGGGLVVVVVPLVGGFVYVFGFSNGGWPWSEISIYAISASLIALTSWFDDLYSLPNRVRFASQSLSAILTIWGFGYWYSINLPFFGQLHLGWLGLPITFLWIVGLINAYNFMDGIDGIAGGQAVVGGLGWAVLGWLSGQVLVSVLGLMLSVTSLGFLLHNWPPARIFMGDVGSAFLGYNFAILPIAAGQADPRLQLAGVLLVWPFVFDTFFTFLRRLHRGENVFTAHRSHLYQRLVIIGYKHSFVTLLYIGMALSGLLLAFVFVSGAKIGDWMVAFGLTVGPVGLWLFVSCKE